MCIINVDDSSKGGSHWMSLIKTYKGIYCYDSFNRNIHKLGSNFKYRKWINANKDRDESYYEADCGQRSLSFLICFVLHGEKIIDII